MKYGDNGTQTVECTWMLRNNKPEKLYNEAQ